MASKNERENKEKDNSEGSRGKNPKLVDIEEGMGAATKARIAFTTEIGCITFEALIATGGADSF